MQSWTLPLPDDFDLQYLMRYLERSPNELLHRVEDGLVYKVLSLQGTDYLLRLRPAEKLELRVLNHAVDADLQSQINAYVKEWWDLERPLQAFYQMAAQDDLLSRVVPDLQGTRLIGAPELFEAICWSIIGQQINLPFAYQLKRRLVETYGEALDFEGTSYWLFPRAERIAATTVEALHSLKITRRKCEYLIGMATEIAAGKLSKQMLLEMNDLKAASKKLISYRGIGPWSAQYVLMRCLRYPDAYPVGDAGLQNAVKALLNMDRKPTEEELHELAVGWDGWRAYATFYLWHSL